MKPGKQVSMAELVFPDLDLLQALAEEPPPRQARVLTFRGPEPPATETPELVREEAR
jgi:hypothetical protein